MFVAHKRDLELLTRAEKGTKPGQNSMYDAFSIF